MKFSEHNLTEKIEIVAIIAATMITEVALLTLIVWSIATSKPVILPVVCGLLAAGIGTFIFFDMKKLIENK